MKLGLHLNNREPLIRPAYDMSKLLDLGEAAEGMGFNSLWVGDSLFSKPRLEPLALLTALTQRTKDVALGSSCLLTVARNPLWLALQWATLDHLSGGRTILGACMGSGAESVKREITALGLPFEQRSTVFEEGLMVMREIWTEGATSSQEKHFSYDDVSFFSGTEMEPLQPIQRPPPIWVVSNIRLMGQLTPEVERGRLKAACERIVDLGTGWMTCCRASHPEELSEQRAMIDDVARQKGKGECTVSYHLTVTIDDSTSEAQDAMASYIGAYYPEISKSVAPDNWGPAGTPDQVTDWFQTFSDARVDHFIIRFGHSDLFAQLDRFVHEVMSAVK